MIRLDGLSKVFKGRKVVDGVSLAAEDGTITGLLGPNGAGKTTTLRMLNGLLQPTEGKAWVDGICVQDDPDRARRRLGLLPDAKGLYVRLTARENITYFGELHGMPLPLIEERIRFLTPALGLSAFLDRRTEGFSQGERVRTALARALVHDPQNLVLDEPGNGLDVGAQRALRAFLRAEREQGRCIVLSSHVLGEMEMVCDRVVVVGHGRVVASGTPDEVKAQTGTDSLEEAFVALVGAGQGWVV